MTSHPAWGFFTAASEPVDSSVWIAALSITPFSHGPLQAENRFARKD
ncbi:hypothetical protein SynMITS9220_01195 [Synechococcus sp. MIT S9220]|nr:hypothetical protein SynMITS9220_01195 [Synechococcus sp. MIT S9220]